VETKHLNIKVYGQVQGVFFRESAREEAEKLEISGFIRNESDGTVYVEAEGDKKSLDKFLDWCNSGPEAAIVEKLEVTEGPLKNFKHFLRN
jgi:acylphosphatase